MVLLLDAAPLTLGLRRGFLSTERPSSGWMATKTPRKRIVKEKLKEVEAVCNLIFTSVYQTSGGAPGGAAGGER